MCWELIGNKQHEETRVRVSQNLQTAYIGWSRTKAQSDTIMDFLSSWTRNPWQNCLGLEGASSLLQQSACLWMSKRSLGTCGQDTCEIQEWSWMRLAGWLSEHQGLNFPLQQLLVDHRSIWKFSRVQQIPYQTWVGVASLTTWKQQNSSMSQHLHFFFRARVHHC